MHTYSFRRFRSLLLLLALAVFPVTAAAQDAGPAPVSGFGDGPIVRGAAGFAFIGSTSVFTPSIHAELPTPMGGVGVLATSYFIEGTSSYSLELTGGYNLRSDDNSKLDPYGFASLGWGLGDASGLVYGGEAGLRYWLSSALAANVYAGYVGGGYDNIIKLGAGVALGL